MCFYFSVLSSKHSIILLQKQGCRLYFHQATNYGKIKSKTRKTENTQLSLCSKKRKTRNYPCVRKNGKHAIILVFEKTENTQLSLCSKNGKHAVILVFEKLNSASHKGIGSRKKKVISNSKTTTLTYFNKLKKKQQDQGGKYFYFSFRSEL